MKLTDFIDNDAIFPALKAQSKKQLLQELSSLAAEKSGLDGRQILEALLQREKLGSTGLGYGVAIPHGKFTGLDKVIGFFGRLEKPIDYDSVDGEPVDLVFLLLAPEGAGADHLKALARISRLLRDGNVASKLRGSDDAASLYSVLTEPSAVASNAA